MRVTERRRLPRRALSLDAATDGSADLALRASLVTPQRQLPDALAATASSEVLAAALAGGLVSASAIGEYPAYAWHRDGESVTEFRLLDSTRGTYVGYTLPPSYWPEGIS